jgi:hypothetical protein
VNGGVCFLDRHRCSARLMLIDFMQRHNPKTGRIEKAKYEERHVYDRVHSFVDDFAVQFSQAHLVLVEKQMRREHLIFAAALVSYLRGKFPGVKTISVSSRTVRKFFGTSDKDYATRKGFSADIAAPFLGAEANAECRLKFYKGDAADVTVHHRGKAKKGPGHVDPQEALNIALCGYYCEAELVALDETPLVFKKNQARRPQPPVRCVDVGALDLDAGISAIAARKRGRGRADPGGRKRVQMMQKHVDTIVSAALAHTY